MAARYLLVNKATRAYARETTPPCNHANACTHLRARTHTQKYLLLFHGNSGFANATQCHVTCTLPAFLGHGRDLLDEPLQSPVTTVGLSMFRTEFEAAQMSQPSQQYLQEYYVDILETFHLVQTEPCALFSVVATPCFAKLRTTGCFHSHNSSSKDILLPLWAFAAISLPLISFSVRRRFSPVYAPSYSTSLPHYRCCTIRVGRTTRQGYVNQQ